jgi:hypothetical protein
VYDLLAPSCTVLLDVQPTRAELLAPTPRLWTAPLSGLTEGWHMADEEVLAYRPFRKTEDSPILYWKAYRWENQGGYAGTSVVPTAVGVFSAQTEERLEQMAKELGYGLRRAEDPM